MNQAGLGTLPGMIGGVNELLMLMNVDVPQSRILAIVAVSASSAERSSR